MVLLLSVISIIGSLLFTPLLMVLLGIVFLASIGKSLGVRKMYINVLLMLFEYGRMNIETAQKRTRKLDESADGDSPSTSSADTGQCDQKAQDQLNSITAQPLTTFVAEYRKAIAANGLSKSSAANGVLVIGNQLLNREDKMLLLPEPPVTVTPKVISDGDASVEKSLTEVDELQHDDEDNKSTDGKEKYKDFELSHCFDLIKAGMEAIVEDEVTSRFEAEELKNWNMLTRTNRRYEFVSWRLTVIWMCGFFIRYFFLLPLRVSIFCIGVMWLTICTAAVGYLPDGNLKERTNRYVQVMCFGILSAALSAVFTYHNRENVPKGGICVANHTSPIDALVLLCDNCYSLIGQKHGGLLGILQRALARASPHIWFERSEVKDRHAVTRKLREHVSNPRNPPILIFPEGTCINNTSVMQFKKGSFEVGSVIYPVAIKYDPRFGDAFWNSSKYSMVQYLYMMMTSWAIVCEVWYLPPMYQREGESAIDFANRVKGVIAHQGGLVDLVWDGQLKRTKPKKEWKERQQEEFSKFLKCE